MTDSRNPESVPEEKHKDERELSEAERAKWGVQPDLLSEAYEVWNEGEKVAMFKAERWAEEYAKWKRGENNRQSEASPPVPEEVGEALEKASKQLNAICADVKLCAKWCESNDPTACEATACRIYIIRRALTLIEANLRESEWRKVAEAASAELASLQAEKVTYPHGLIESLENQNASLRSQVEEMREAAIPAAKSCSDRIINYLTDWPDDDLTENGPCEDACAGCTMFPLVKLLFPATLSTEETTP